MADANQELFDASLRHQIGVRRFAGGEVNRALELLQRADRELSIALRRHLLNLGRNRSPRGERYRAMIKDMRQLRREVMKQFQQELRQMMFDFGKVEAEFEERMMRAALPFDFEFAVASAQTLRAIVTSTPFSGGTNAARTLNEWFTALQAADQRRLIDAINLGLVQQEGNDQIVRRVVGSRDQGFTNGALAITRRNAEAVVRTATNHVSNLAREATWEANEDIIMALKWNATLDGRTSAVCRARDGHFAPIRGEKTAGIPQPRLDPPTARPPAHPNCRSVMIAVLDPEGVAGVIGERPFVRDARTRRQREIDFRADARRRVGEEQWKRLDRSQRNTLVRDERNAWAEANIGQVPADVDYDTWLRRQSTAFQNEVLGQTKGRAFRRGLKLDKFVDRRGNELTIDELRETQPEFF